MKAWFASFILFAGCARQSHPTGTLDESDSQQAGAALSAGIEEGAAGFGPVNAGAAIDATCITLSGDTADPDQDNIPSHATLTFACSDTRLGYTGNLTGTESVTDDQPNTVAWAFSANAELRSSLTAPSSASIVSDRIGTIVASQVSALGPFSLERTLDVTTVFRGALGNTVTVDETNGWTITFTPQATWTPGGVVVTGSLTATGNWDVTIGNKSASATLDTPTALTLTPSCATRVTAGTATATYDAGNKTNTITVTWTGCGASTVTFSQT